jgi:hypothetical protein
MHIGPVCGDLVAFEIRPTLTMLTLRTALMSDVGESVVVERDIAILAAPKAA